MDTRRVLRISSSTCICSRDVQHIGGAPAMVELGGGSVGLQIGGEATDVVILIMNREGIDSLLKDKFTLDGMRRSPPAPWDAKPLWKLTWR